MRIKIWIVLAAVLLLSGCATAKKEYLMESQKLKDRANHLEAELQARDREIERLENELIKARAKNLRMHEEKKRDKRVEKEVAK